MNLQEDVDYYWKNDKMVFTAAYLLKRGYCCKLRCKHCPYNDHKESNLLRHPNKTAKDILKAAGYIEIEERLD